MKAESEVERHRMERSRQLPRPPMKLSDDYVERSGRKGREAARRIIEATRKDLAKLPTARNS